eukprot:172378_1
MAEEEKNPAEKKCVWILIRGCTSPPKDLKISKREGNKSGDYLDGLRQDMKNMEAFVRNHKNYHWHNSISNQNMDSEYVLNEIANTCKYAKDNDAFKVCIYYTGHGYTGTGNWCFNDKKTVSLDDIINIMFEHYAPHPWFDIHADCCYSGNWAVQLKEYESVLKNTQIAAASWPDEVAYDHPDHGGYFTCFQSGVKKLKKCNLNYSQAFIINNKYSMDCYSSKDKGK